MQWKHFSYAPSLPQPGQNQVAAANSTGATCWRRCLHFVWPHKVSMCVSVRRVCVGVLRPKESAQLTVFPQSA